MPFESPPRMVRYIRQSLHGESSLIMMVLLIILMYYFIMDIILYVSLQNTNVFDQTRYTSYVYSPFHPLSVKLLMTDPSDHYLFEPITEHFDHVTRFSKVFYFITPNMISMTHLSIGLIAAGMVSSETLRTRRLGVILYEFRNCLDTFDGVIFRSHSGIRIYQNHPFSYGYVFDGLCDVVAGFTLSCGCILYLWQRPPFLTTGNTHNEALPWTKNENVNGPALEKHKNHNQPAIIARRNSLFFKILCLAIMLALGGYPWVYTVESYSDVLQTKMDNSLATVSTCNTFSNILRLCKLERIPNNNKLERDFQIITN